MWSGINAVPRASAARHRPSPVVRWAQTSSPVPRALRTLESLPRSGHLTVLDTCGKQPSFGAQPSSAVLRPNYLKRCLFSAVGRNPDEPSQTVIHWRFLYHRKAADFDFSLNWKPSAFNPCRFGCWWAFALWTELWFNSGVSSQLLVVTSLAADWRTLANQCRIEVALPRPIDLCMWWSLEIPARLPTLNLPHNLECSVFPSSAALNTTCLCYWAYWADSQRLQVTAPLLLTTSHSPSHTEPSQ